MNYKVRLDIFEGPLDLLLYLIQKNELDIHDIPITLVTEQYLEHLDLMQSLNLDVAGEFLVMASMLMRIKSKMLLPPDEVPVDAPEEEDPREELVRKLLEYMRYKEAAQDLRKMETFRMDSFSRYAPEIEMDVSDSPFLDGSLFDLITAFGKVLQHMPKDVFHQIIKDEFTVSEKVQEILGALGPEGSRVRFTQLFRKAMNRFEAITIFLALLELIRLKEVCFEQNRLFDDIEIIRSTSRRLEAEASAVQERASEAVESSASEPISASAESTETTGSEEVS